MKEKDSQFSWLTEQATTPSHLPIPTRYLWLIVCVRKWGYLLEIPPSSSYFSFIGSLLGNSKMPGMYSGWLLLNPQGLSWLASIKTADSLRTQLIREGENRVEEEESIDPIWNMGLSFEKKWKFECGKVPKKYLFPIHLGMDCSVQNLHFCHFV